MFAYVHTLKCVYVYNILYIWLSISFGNDHTQYLQMSFIHTNKVMII
jgi:hypothetical protein